jgi:hypothetical protein
MADQPQQASPMVVPPIPTQGASQFMISMTAGDILLTIGHGRVGVRANEKGQPSPVPTVEWLMSLSLSPTSCRTLLLALSQTVEIYEKTFGKIPVDPKVKLEVDEVGTFSK